MFEFQGLVSASKSWLNRAMIIQHFNPQLRFQAFSNSEDVVSLRDAIQAISKTDHFNLGMGGTSFRFFAFLISRHAGDWRLQAHSRLLQRPQQDLVILLNQLGVQSEFSENELRIKSQGWKAPKAVVTSAEVSSQFASGLLLSSWNLTHELVLQIKKPIASLSYLKMTLQLLRSAGMNIDQEETHEVLTLKVPPLQKAPVAELNSELDVSSAFSLIAAGIVGGDVTITNWQPSSNQPDMVLTEILKKMKIHFEVHNREFKIQKQSFWSAIDCDLNQAPDLFPVLSVLCALANGISHLSGATQLKHKESDRIQKTHELLSLVGFKSEIQPDGIKIWGQSSIQDLKSPIKFNPDHDHRMAMAAAILKLKGYNIEIENPEVVNKSYPDFWKDIGLSI